jgi:electron transfer flavoprotein alpha subunit
VSAAGDSTRPGTPGAAAPDAGPAAAPHRCLLVVLEPGEGAEACARATLTAEGVRLAGLLSAELRLVTWTQGAADTGPDAVAAAVAGAAQGLQPLAVLLADTDLGRQLAPMVAHRLGSGAVVACSDVLVRETVPVFVKPVYGGWLEEEVRPAEGSIPVATLDLAGMSEPEVELETMAAAQSLEAAAGVSAGVRRLELIPPAARTVDLVHARRIVAAGSGTVSAALLEAAAELADLLDGSVGATRPVVDDGHLPKERLIGQTGRTVTPELYLALGISGSPHHVAGVKKAGRFLSINQDVSAPIFQFSDVGYVADLEAVLPPLVKRIKEYRDAAGRADDSR